MTQSPFGAAVVLLSAGISVAMPRAANPMQFQADSWTAECDLKGKSGDCSIMAMLKGNSNRGTKGSFAFAADLQSGQFVLAGKPDPVGAIIRVDRNAPIACVGRPYCLVSSGQADTLVAQLSSGRLMLIDVFLAHEVFRLSVTTQGYRAGLAKIQAHRDLLR
jgi:invasion protein IalB